ITLLTFGISAIFRPPIDDNEPAGNIEDPVFRNSGTRVQTGFDDEVQRGTAVDNFDNQYQLIAARMALLVVGLVFPDHGDIRLRFVSLPVRDGDFDRSLVPNPFASEDAEEPREHLV